MSHFTVLVVGENPEQQLAPYQENNMDDCPKEYLAFNDQEDEMLEDYNTKTKSEFYPDIRGTKILDSYFQDFIKLNIGDQTEVNFDLLLDPVDFSLRGSRIDIGNKGLFWSDKKGNEEFYYEVLSLMKGKVYIIKRIDPPREIPFTETYATFEKYCEEWCGFDKRDPDKGRFGYWENPNAKWDWYSLGGRWTGLFKLRSGAEGIAGEPGLMTKSAKEGYVDQAYKRDIDFEGMSFEAYNKALKDYDETCSYFPDNKIPKLEFTWKEALAKYKANSSDGDFDIDEVRAYYHNQEAVKKLDYARKNWSNSKEGKKSKSMPNIFFDGLEEFQMSREDYAEEASATCCQTFAVIVDGKWHERGSMGWFGCVSDEKDSEAWSKEFRALLNKLPDDVLLSVYDCHI